MTLNDIARLAGVSKATASRAFSNPSAVNENTRNRVLEIARMRGEGRLVMEIRDGQIACNNGRFAVDFAPGAANRVTMTEERADMSLSIQDFTRLILGCYDVEDLRWLPNVRLNCALEKAARIFYRKPMYISQDF